MKKILFIVFSLSLSFGFSQQLDSTTAKKSTPKNFFGFGTGINAYTGLFGFGAELQGVDDLYIRLSAGWGTWKGKFTAGLKYQKNNASGLGVAAYYTYNTGAKKVETTLEVQGYVLQNQMIVPATAIDKVFINYKPASSFNLALSYNWLIKNKNKLYFELNYGFKVEDEPFEIDPTNNPYGLKLTDNSKKSLRLIQPGGLGIAVGYMFGL
jgi:hypothetical protein